MLTREFMIFFINIVFTMACPNFKKGLKMASGPLGVNLLPCSECFTDTCWNSLSINQCITVVSEFDTNQSMHCSGVWNWQPPINALQWYLNMTSINQCISVVSEFDTNQSMHCQWCLNLTPTNQCMAMVLEFVKHHYCVALVSDFSTEH
jgi:hypothetical protein